MHRVLMVDVDPDRKEHIRIGPVQQFENEQIRPDPIYDMACLCEAVCLMIHVCHKEGIKDQSDSIRDCIKHLKHGFIDETFKARMNINEDAPNNNQQRATCHPKAAST